MRTSVCIGELDGVPVAFALGLANINEAIRDLDGRLLPFGWARLLYRLKFNRIRSGRMPLMGVRRRLHATPVGLGMAFAAVEGRPARLSPPRRRLRRGLLGARMQHPAPANPRADGRGAFQDLSHLCEGFVSGGPYTALVLAARRAADDPVACAAGVGNKCLADVGGAPMLVRVIDALSASGVIGSILVSTDDSALLRHEPALETLVASGRVRLVPLGVQRSAKRPAGAYRADRSVGVSGSGNHGRPCAVEPGDGTPFLRRDRSRRGGPYRGACPRRDRPQPFSRGAAHLSALSRRHLFGAATCLRCAPGRRCAWSPSGAVSNDTANRPTGCFAPAAWCR